ncbi:MAG: polysaccharide deacetylase family protein [Candidatus Eremiobacteraeota bacterium]|nr:polysaccharide deacetylase family protein [Candidatus Eremiobacteraeota bacterium]MCW5869533.1 polysaccharide deacetylase family protein [Candidatus Eremiobacteraeota bacterium]
MKQLLIAAVLTLPLAAKPLVVPPGAFQPRAPGYQPAPAAPSLRWQPRPHQIHSVEYAGNGHLEVAHALILADPGSDEEFLLGLAGQAVRGALAQRSSLDQVDVSVYHRATYLGFGGPPPVLTASVPRARLPEFEREGLNFERLWNGARAPLHTAHRPESEVREGQIVFHGSQSQLENHQRRQQEQYGEQDGLFFRGSPRRSRLALTFDDSPHPMYATLLLDTLARAGVQATFFCIGRNARVYPYLISDMVEGGHEVANHTYHHLRLPDLPRAEVFHELKLANTVLEGISGRPVRLFRPPGGDYSPQTLDIARSLGLVTTFWTDDPGDFNNPGEAILQDRLLDHLRPGGIVLLHDNVQETIDILPAFLELARRQGFRLGTASQLLD